MSATKVLDITVVEDESEDENINSCSSEEFDFSSALDLRKNLTETFDKHVHSESSVAEKVARFQQKKSSALSIMTRSQSSNSSALLAVSLRIRPPMSKDGSENANTIEILNPASQDGSTTIRTYPPYESNTAKVVRKGDKVNGVKEFDFQHVFGPTTTQHEVYSTVAAPLVHGLFPSSTSVKHLGGSALIFAYGITNAGKTHTIMGDSKNESQRGIIPRSLQDIFARMEGSNKYELYMSYIEIYNENVYDLLPIESQPSFASLQALKIRENQDGEPFVKGLTKHRVKHVHHGLELANKAKNKRHTSSNNINSDSSRSHCICQFELRYTGAPDADAGETKQCVNFWIVDLAGSERTKRTGLTHGSTRQKEATLINKSLMTLMRCLSVMRQNQSSGVQASIVPFRESKLTHLFTKHLTGPCASRTAMMVNVNPAASDFDETQHVLAYAVAARSVQISCDEYAKKRQAMGLKSEYGLNGRRKRDGQGEDERRPRKLAKLVKKYSPKNVFNRRHMKRHCTGEAGGPSIPTTKTSRTETRAMAQSSRSASLEKKIMDLTAALSIAQGEAESLRLQKDDLRDEIENMEEQIRMEIADEMEEHMQVTRENYEEIIKSLEQQVRANPLPSRSSKKFHEDRTEQLIEEYMDKVEECEEEMIRMRKEHEEEMNALEAECEDKVIAKHAEFEANQEENKCEIESLQNEVAALKKENVSLQSRLSNAEDEKREIEVKYEKLCNQKEKDEMSRNEENPEDPVTKSTKKERAVTSKTNRAPFGAVCSNSDQSSSSADEDEQKLVFPKKAASFDKSKGAYIRPVGRHPRNREWDEQIGAWRLSVSQ